MLEVLLELEYLKADLSRFPLKEASQTQQLMLLEKLVDITAMILKATTSRECLETLEQISNGDMT